MFDEKILILSTDPICIKNSSNTHINAFLLLISVAHSFSNPFSFIITSTRSNRVHVAPVIFFLWMLFWVPFLKFIKQSFYLGCEKRSSLSSYNQAVEKVYCNNQIIFILQHFVKCSRSREKIY